MAVTTVSSDPNFGISYKNTIGVEDLTIYQLISNRDSVPIPTDSDGNNPVFTEANIVFEIKIADQDDTSNWVISESTTTNTTITVVDATKTVSVTAIAADVGSFVIKAERYGYPTITRKINVFKAKAGADGSGAASGADGSVQFATSGAFDSDTSFVWDDTDKRLSIGGRMTVGANHTGGSNTDNIIYFGTDAVTIHRPASSSGMAINWNFISDDLVLGEINPGSTSLFRIGNEPGGNQVIEANKSVFGMAIINRQSTNATPVFAPYKTDLTTGIGGNSNEISLISQSTESIRVTSTGVFVYNLKSGTTQVGAGATANELWHDTTDNTVKIGV